MWVLTLVGLGILAVALWVSFRRRALKRNERLTSAAVLDSERSVLMGLIFIVSAFYVFPSTPWRYVGAAVLAGVVLGLVLARRYVARAERQLAQDERLEAPYSLKAARWSRAWWLLLLVCLGLLVLSFLRTPLLSHREILLTWSVSAGTLLAEGLYVRLWVRTKGAAPHRSDTK